jgi:hypothetical protein
VTALLHPTHWGKADNLFLAHRLPRSFLEIKATHYFSTRTSNPTKQKKYPPNKASVTSRHVTSRHDRHRHLVVVASDLASISAKRGCSSVTLPGVFQLQHHVFDVSNVPINDRSINRSIGL